MAERDNLNPLSFCDTCELRGQTIAPGTLCARSALDNVEMVFGMITVNNAEVPGDHVVVDEMNREAESTFAGLFTRDVLVCIESVSHGGDPVVPSDD